MEEQPKTSTALTPQSTSEMLDNALKGRRLRKYKRQNLVELVDALRDTCEPSEVQALIKRLVDAIREQYRFHHITYLKDAGAICLFTLRGLVEFVEAAGEAHLRVLDFLGLSYARASVGLLRDLADIDKKSFLARFAFLLTRLTTAQSMGIDGFLVRLPYNDNADLRLDLVRILSDFVNRCFSPDGNLSGDVDPAFTALRAEMESVRDRHVSTQPTIPAVAAGAVGEDDAIGPPTKRGTGCCDQPQGERPGEEEPMPGGKRKRQDESTGVEPGPSDQASYGTYFGGGGAGTSGGAGGSAPSGHAASTFVRSIDSKRRHDVESRNISTKQESDSTDASDTFTAKYGYTPNAEFVCVHNRDFDQSHLPKPSQNKSSETAASSLSTVPLYDLSERSVLPQTNSEDPSPTHSIEQLIANHASQHLVGSVDGNPIGANLVAVAVS